MAIQSFSDRATESFFKYGEIPVHAGWQKIAKIALRKLGPAAVKILDYHK